MAVLRVLGVDACLQLGVQLSAITVLCHRVLIPKKRKGVYCNNHNYKSVVRLHRQYIFLNKRNFRFIYQKSVLVLVYVSHLC